MAKKSVTKMPNSVPDFHIIPTELGCVLRDIRSNLELEFQKIAAIAQATLSHPDVKAGLALERRLLAACDDETIKASAVVLSLTEVMHSLLSKAAIGADVAQVFSPLTTQAARQAISNDRRKAAESKNAKVRAWVLNEWKNREDKGSSKAAFARQHANLVLNKFKIRVTSDTIARDWLPKVKK